MISRATFIVGMVTVAVLIAVVAFNDDQFESVESGRQDGIGLVDHRLRDSSLNELDQKHVEREQDKVRDLVGYNDDWCSPKELNASGRSVYWMKVHEWRRGIGWFRDVDSVAYEGYSSDTLRNLGMQGDLLALDTLYQRLSANADSVKDAKELLYPAVAFGSTKAAITLALIHRLKADRMDDGTFADDEDLYRIMAFYEIAIMSGDVVGAEEGMTFLRGIGRQLDAGEQAEVSGIARQIISDLREEYGVYEQKTTKLPKAMANFNQRHTRRILTDSEYDGWGSKYLVDTAICSKHAIQAINRTRRDLGDEPH